MSRVIAGRHDGRRAEERAGYKFSSREDEEEPGSYSQRPAAPSR